MIDLKTLSQSIENGLNANAEGVKYAIFADAGTFAKAIKTRKERTDITNGVLTLMSSSVVPTQTVVIATMEARLEIVVKLPLPETDGEVIALHRSILDGYFQKTIVQPLPDENGDIYSVSSVYSLASSGAEEMRGMAGTSITFTVYCSYSFIQNGLNSYNCIFTLDGVQIPYSAANITRVPVMESNCYGGGESVGSAKNVPTSSALNFKFTQVPGLKPDGNTFSESVLNCLLKGDLNVKHNLKLIIPGYPVQTFSVLFAQTSLSLDGVQNAGHSIDFVEAAEIEGG